MYFLCLFRGGLIDWSVTAYTFTLYIYYMRGKMIRGANTHYNARVVARCSKIDGLRMVTSKYIYGN